MDGLRCTHRRLDVLISALCLRRRRRCVEFGAFRYGWQVTAGFLEALPAAGGFWVYGWVFVGGFGAGVRPTATSLS